MSTHDRHDWQRYPIYDKVKFIRQMTAVEFNIYMNRQLSGMSQRYCRALCGQPLSAHVVRRISGAAGSHSITPVRHISSFRILLSVRHCSFLVMPRKLNWPDHTHWVSFLSADIQVSSPDGTSLPYSDERPGFCLR